MRHPALLALFPILAACATGARAQNGSAPPTREAGAPSDGGDAPPHDARGDAPTADASGAEADLQQAEARHLAGDHEAARSIAAGLVEAPSAALRGRAKALLALIALEQGDASGARGWLHPGPEASEATHFLAGVAEARLGQGEQAWARLAPFAERGAPPIPGTTSEKLDMMLNVAVAESAASTGRVIEALQAWQRYADRAQPHERAFALHRAEAAVGQLAPEVALPAWKAASGKLVRAALGPKAALALAAQGQAAEARAASDEAMALRKELDAVATSAGSAWVGTGDPGRVGLSVPLTGAGQQLGLALTRGSVVALGAPSSATDVGPVQVMVRDTSGRGGPLTAATELAREEAVLGIVGLPDATTIEQMSRDGVPYLVLGGANPAPQSSAFQLVHDTEARAQALARAARAQGVRSFAILAPDTEAARKTSESFRAAVAALGGQVVSETRYAAGATSFTKEVQALKKQRWDALFVPDTADRLELIAPALAVADLWPQPASQVIAPTGERRTPPGGGPPRRNVLLLSTAPGASQRLLERAGRYVQGALLAPGFHADPESEAAARFVAEFRTLYGRDPGASDAYGFDGVHLLRACVERGARSRNDVLRMLGGGSEFRGVTGNIRFGGDHGRADPPLVYEVRGDAIRALP